MKETFKLTVLILLVSYGTAHGQDKKNTFQLKLCVDQTFDVGGPNFNNPPANTLQYERINYRLSGPAIGLAYFRNRFGVEFLAQRFSNNTTTTPGTAFDSTGRPYGIHVKNSQKVFAYSFEMNYKLTPKKWKNALPDRRNYRTRFDILLGAGVSHENSRIIQNNYWARQINTITSNKISVYVSPKIQYRMSKSFFIEAALPYALYQTEAVNTVSKYEYREEPYRDERKGEGWRKDRITARLGLGYSF